MLDFRNIAQYKVYSYFHFLYTRDSNKNNYLVYKILLEQNKSYTWISHIYDATDVFYYVIIKSDKVNSPRFDVFIIQLFCITMKRL